MKIEKDLMERAEKLVIDWANAKDKLEDWESLEGFIARFAQEVRNETTSAVKEKLEDDFDDSYSMICKKYETERRLNKDLEERKNTALQLFGKECRLNEELKSDKNMLYGQLKQSRDHVETERRLVDELIGSLKKIDDQKMCDLPNNMMERVAVMTGLWMSLKMIAREALESVRKAKNEC